MSNSNKVSVNKLSSEILKALTEYKENIKDEVKEVSDKLIKEASQELKQISPKAEEITYLRKGSEPQKSRKLCKRLDY